MKYFAIVEMSKAVLERERKILQETLACVAFWSLYLQILLLSALPSSCLLHYSLRGDVGVCGFWTLYLQMKTCCFSWHCHALSLSLSFSTILRGGDLGVWLFELVILPSTENLELTDIKQGWKEGIGYVFKKQHEYNMIIYPIKQHTLIHRCWLTKSYMGLWNGNIYWQEKIIPHRRL